MVTQEAIRRNIYDTPPLREGEEFGGITRKGNVVVIDQFAKDQSDLSNLSAIRRKEAEIMRLPLEERKPAFTSLSPILANFSENEATFRALEQLYTEDEVRFNGLKDVDDAGVAKSWFECFSNARAVRERKTATTRLLLESIKTASFQSPQRPIDLTSIASGSARCVVETLQQKLKTIDVQARMLDWDPEAREYSKKLAKDAGVADQIEIIPGDVIRIRKHLSSKPIDVAEAVGIIDYFDERTTIFFLSQIYSLLRQDGVLVASNIMPNRESNFIHTAVGWRPMHYRTEDTFLDLLSKSGFDASNCRIHKIPSGIYCIIEAKK